MTPDNRRAVVRSPDEPAWAADVRELTIAVNRATRIKRLLAERVGMAETIVRLREETRLREAVRVAARVVTDHHEPDAAGGCR